MILGLSESLNINPVLSAVLVQRGITDYEQARDFFRPSLDQLHDPFLMKDMDRAVDRLDKAVASGEKILVYGDYDVDGTTAVSLVFSFLRDYTSNIDYYVPDRYTEGYGVSSQGVNWASENGFSLIIALDCGIKAFQQVELARSLGIDFIICDHHRPADKLPLAVAVLDPKRDDCPYPFSDLCGCGVGFKLIQAFCLKRSIAQDKLYRFLDLAAVSISSDLVPLIGENRILSYFGLKKLNTDPLPGLAALKQISRQGKEVDVTGIVFGIGPRINAAGRIKHARASVQLLVSERPNDALDLAKLVDTHNTTRRDYDSTTTEEALGIIESNQDLKNAKSTVLYKSDWHKGVIGIVASRCIEKFYRPTIILTRSNGKITGSARSVEGFDIYEALTQCSDLLDHFGGHMYAAGMTLDLDQLTEFQKRFEEVVSQQITEELLTPRINVDQKVDFDRINYRFYKILKQMAPFGPGNMDPVFVSENVYLSKSPRLIKDKHLKCFLKQEGNSNELEAIGFGMGDFYERLKPHQPFSIAFNLEESEFMDRKSLNLVLKDIKFIT